MPDTPTPQPGEIWENDDGERRFVTHTKDNGMFYSAVNAAVRKLLFSSHVKWHDWATRTDARRILEAKKQ